MKINLKRLLEYEAVIEEAVSTYEHAAKAKPGESVTVPNVRVRIGRKPFEAEAHKIRRLE